MSKTGAYSLIPQALRHKAYIFTIRNTKKDFNFVAALFIYIYICK